MQGRKRNHCPPAGHRQGKPACRPYLAPGRRTKTAGFEANPAWRLAWSNATESHRAGAYWTPTGGVPIALSSTFFTNEQLPRTIYLEGDGCGIGGMTGTMSATVRKLDGAVLEVTYSGSFVDSCDFNIKSPYNTAGAIVQAGYNTLGAAGRTFQSGLQFERTTDNIHYNFSIGE
jgi:hypothetical protein